MEPTTQEWTRFTRPGFLLAFSYPDPTPDGQAVVRDDEPFRGYARVHLSSPDRRELYLEIVRFHDVAPEDEYRQHRPYLEHRFGSGSVGPLTDTSLGERPALTYRFGGTGDEEALERSALLVQVAGETYRIIFDPRSEVNARVVATITEADRA